MSVEEQTNQEIDLGGIDFQNLPPAEKKTKSGRELNFQHEWTIFYDDSHRRGGSSEDWEKSIKVLGKFSNIEEFWKYWNVLEDVSKLQEGINLRLFKSGIRPSWEDPQNENGGKFSFSASKNEMSKYWSKIVLATIGEQFKYGEDICGVILSLKPGGAVINVWNKSSDDVALITTTTQELEEILGLGMPVRYIPHKKQGLPPGIIPRPSNQHQLPKKMPFSHLAASVATSGIPTGNGPREMGCIPRHTVDGLAALKSGNLRASMDNARFGKVNAIDLEGLSVQKKAEILAKSMGGEKANMKAVDLQNARMMFRNTSTDRFPSALMSPMPSNKNKPKNPSSLGKSVSMIDSPLSPESPHSQLRRRYSDSDEWEDERDEDSPLNQIASPLLGNILSRLPAQQDMSMHSGTKSEWKRGATTLKPVKQADEEDSDPISASIKSSSTLSSLSERRSKKGKVEKSKIVNEKSNSSEEITNSSSSVDLKVVAAILVVFALILYFFYKYK